MWGIVVSMFIMAQVHKKLVVLASEMPTPLANLEI